MDFKQCTIILEFNHLLYSLLLFSCGALESHHRIYVSICHIVCHYSKRVQCSALFIICTDYGLVLLLVTSSLINVRFCVFASCVVSFVLRTIFVFFPSSLSYSIPLTLLAHQRFSKLPNGFFITTFFAMLLCFHVSTNHFESQFGSGLFKLIY